MAPSVPTPIVATRSFREDALSKLFPDGCPCQQDLCERLLPKVQKHSSGQEEQDDGDSVIVLTMTMVVVLVVVVALRY